MLKFSIQWKHLKSNCEIIIKVCRAQQNIKRGYQFITKKLFFDISSLSWRQQGKMKNEISNDQKTYLIKEFLLIQLLRPKILTFLSDWLFKQIKQFGPSGHKNLRARFASGAAMLLLSLSPVRSCTPLLVLPARTSVKGLFTWRSLGLAVAGENPWPLCNDEALPGWQSPNYFLP